MKWLISILCLAAIIAIASTPAYACHPALAAMLAPTCDTCASAAYSTAYAAPLGLARARALAPGYGVARIGASYAPPGAAFAPLESGYDDLGALADAGLSDTDLDYLDSAGDVQRQAFFGRAYGAVAGRGLYGSYTRGRGLFGRGLGRVARGIGGIGRARGIGGIARGVGAGRTGMVRQRGQAARSGRAPVARQVQRGRNPVARQARGGRAPVARQAQRGRPPVARQGGGRAPIVRNRGVAARGSRPAFRAPRGGGRAAPARSAPARGGRR